MLRRLSSGELIDPAFTLFSFPTGWHYDALRGLDYMRAASVTPDARAAEATDLVRSKRDAEGLLPLENHTRANWSTPAFAISTST